MPSKPYDIVIDVILTERDSYSASERYSYRLRTPLESFFGEGGVRDPQTTRDVLGYVEAGIGSALAQAVTLIPAEPKP